MTEQNKQIVELEQKIRLLLQREEHYRRIVEDSDYYIYELDQNGAFAYVNQGFTNHFSIGSDELKSIPYWDFIREDFREQVANMVLTKLKNLESIFYLECPVNPKYSGKEMWVGQHCKAYYEGNICVRTSVISYDITNKKKQVDELTFSREDIQKAYDKLKNQESQLISKTEELEKANLQLSDALSFQRAILSSAEIAIISTDLDGRITQFNETAEKWLGYEADSLLYRKSPDLFHTHQELKQRSEDLVAEFGEGQFSGVDTLHRLADLYNYYQQEWTYIRKDGSQFPVLLSISPIIGAEEQKLGYLHLAIDISLQTQTELKLSQALTTQYLVTEHLQTAILFEDRHRRISFLNGRFTKLFGIKGTPESYSGKRSEWIFDDIANKFMDDTVWHHDQASMLKEQEQHLNKTFRLKNGTTLERDFIPVKEKGKVTGFIWQFRDVSERKLQEDLLTQKQSELEAFVGAAPAAIAMFDQQMHYIAASERWLEEYQLEQNQFIGRSHYELFPDTPEEWRRIHQRCLKGAIEREEEELVSAEGEPQQWIKWEVRPWLNSKYQVGGIIILTEDITSRKEQEEELRIAKQKAEEASEAKAQFLSTMSHEIRTPMNAVIGMTHLLLQEEPRAEQLENLKTLRFAADNLLALINDILDFNKIEAGKISFEQIDFSLIELLGSIKNSLQISARQKNIALRAEIAQQVPPVLVGDPVRIGQILNNLLSNAIKFTQEGEVAIKVEVLQLTDTNVTLHFAIQDTGIGIPHEQLNTIFDRFSQASKDTTRKFGGSGLGLSITKRLLELLQTDITVESKLGKGSTFSFDLKLPLSKRTTLPVQHHQLADAQIRLLQGKRILLVEDNEVNRIVASKFLRKWEARLSMVTNGHEALDLVQEKEFDLILMDLQMPIMDGYEATRQIRALNTPYYQQIPIIALSAELMDVGAEQMEEAGINAAISKPFAPQELARTILQQLGLYQPTAEQASPPPGTPEATPGAEGTLFDWSRVISLSDGKRDFIIELTQSYIDTLTQFRAELEQATTAQDVELLQSATHRVKSSLRFLQMLPLEQRITALKAAVETPGAKAEEIKQLAAACQEIIGEIIKQLRQHLQQYDLDE